MDQLIQRLQEKITILAQELAEARTQIETLKQTVPETSVPETSVPETSVPETQSPYDLLSQMSDLTPNDQLQLYIEDSLDIDPFESLNEARNNEDKNQLSFDSITIDENSTSIPLTENASANENKVILDDLSPVETPSSDSTPVEPVNENVQTTSSAVEPDTDQLESADAAKEQTTEAKPSAKKRNKNKQNNLKLIQLLEKKYPKAFNWNNPSPLKIGIDKEMQIDEELTESKLKRALAAYTRSDRYKKSLAKQKMRIDLEGKPVFPKKAPKSAENKPSNKSTQQPKKPHKPKEIKVESQEHDGLSDEERMQKKLAMLLAKK